MYTSTHSTGIEEYVQYQALDWVFIQYGPGQEYPSLEKFNLRSRVIGIEEGEKDIIIG